MRIAIIGAGVAGCLLAERLADAPGFDVEIFERTDAHARSGAGTALNLGPNAMRALRLHAPARHAALCAHALPWRTWTTFLVDGTRLAHLDLLDVATDPGIKLRWAVLYEQLRAPVAHRIRHGHALAGLETDAHGRPIPVFDTADGPVRQGAFDLLVGADGRYSRTRVLAAGEPPSTLLGVGNWRLLIEDAGAVPFAEYGQWFNGNARLLAYPLPGGAAYLTGTFPLADAEPIPEALRTPAAQRALFTPEGAPPCPSVAWMLDHLAAGVGAIHWARSQTVPLLRTAPTAAGPARVLLLGDAAQAMVPTLGQGASQAIECGVIAGAILAAGGDAAAIAAARDPRVAFVRAFSADASDTLLPPCDPVAGTRAKTTPAFLARLRTLYTDVPGPEQFRRQ